MKRTITAIILTLFAACIAQAAVPKLINYQGYLKQSGVAVTGTKSVTLSLYDAATGGSQLCTTGAQSVAVTNGLFSYKIGSAGCDLSAINWDNAVYLELTVEGTTLSPREQITGSAYSVETKAVNVEFTPAGNVAATDVQSAIEELDNEKLAKNGDGSGLTGVVASGGVAKTGDTMSGSLAVQGNISASGNITAATGTITAQSFAGNGSALTGVTSTDNTKVLKAGDTMSGALNMGGNNISNAGTIAATSFTGSGAGLTGVTGTDNTKVAKAGDTMSGALGISQGGATASLYVYQTNSLYNAGRFEITNSSNTYGAVAGLTTGTGGSGVSGVSNGNGVGVAARSYGNSAGSYALWASQDGTVASAGRFTIPNASNANSVLYVDTAGTGQLYFGNHTGASGNLIQLQSGGVDKFVVNKTGDVTATSFTGNGSGLSGVVASGAVAKTGDTMSGALGISQGGATASLYVYQTGTTDEAGWFEVNNASNASNALTAVSNGTGHTILSVNDGSGSAVYASSNGSGNALRAGTAGSGSAAIFPITNVLNTNPAIYASTDGSGDVYKATTSGIGALYYGNHTGASGKLIKLQSGGVDRFVVDKSGTNFITTDSSPYYGVSVNHSGTGPGVYVESNGTNEALALRQNNSLMPSLFSGIYNSSNPYYSIGGYTEGTGHAAQFGVANTSSATSTVDINNNGNNASSSLISGNHSGTSGNLIKLQSGGADKFTVTKTGDVTATSFTGSGAGLTGVVASGAVAKTGDTMSGALEIVQTVATPSLYVEQTGAGVAIKAVVGTDGTAVSGESSDLGYGVYGLNNGGSSAGVYGLNIGGTGAGVWGKNDGGTGFGVWGSNNSSGMGVYGENNSNGFGVYGQNSSTGSGVYGYNTGTGNVISGNHTGASGNLIKLQSGGTDRFVMSKDGTTNITTDATNEHGFWLSHYGTLEGVVVKHFGNTGLSSGYFSHENTSSTGNVLSSSQKGLGSSGVFSIANTGNAANTLSVNTNGTGSLIYGNHTGTSGWLMNLQDNGTNRLRTKKNGETWLDTDATAGYGIYLNNYGTLEGLAVKNFGNTIYSAGYFEQNNPSSSGAALIVYQKGTGDVIKGYSDGTSSTLLRLQNPNGTNKFVVNNSGKTTYSDTNVAGRTTITSGTACKTVSSTVVNATSVISITPITTSTSTTDTALKVKSITAATSFDVCTCGETNVSSNIDFSYIVFN